MLNDKESSNMKTKISIIVVILVSMAFIMKLSQHENHEDGDHQENVTFIHNDDSAWGDTPQIKLELSRTIGGLDNIDENYYFYNPTDFAFDDSGYLYVADSGNNRIQKYDKNGKYIATFGRKGQGPGEFTSVDALNIAKNGNIYALDSGQNRMIILSPEGKEISRFELERAYGNFELNSRNNTIKQTFEYDGKLMHILDTDGKEIVKFLDQIDTKDRDIKKYNRYFSFTVDKDENIFVAYNLRNLIEKYTPSGELLMKFDRKLEYEEQRDRIIMVIICLIGIILGSFGAVACLMTFTQPARRYVNSFTEVGFVVLVCLSLVGFIVFKSEGIMPYMRRKYEQFERRVRI